MGASLIDSLHTTTASEIYEVFSVLPLADRRDISQTRLLAKDQYIISEETTSSKHKQLFDKPNRQFLHGKRERNQAAEGVAVLDQHLAI